MENIAFRILPVSMVVPATKTSTVTSAAINISGYEGAAFLVYYGAPGDTLSSTVKWTGKIQECATENGTYTDVADADVNIGSTNSFGLIDATSEGSALYWIGYNGSNNYIKVVITATGTHTYGTPIAIIALLGMPRSQVSGGDVNP